jgi:Domain of unknown function (DUF1707)
MISIVAVPQSPTIETVTSVDLAPAPAEPAPDLRVGLPERTAAREALEEHLADERLTPAEFDQRWAVCQEARTQAELMRAFVDLPAPHPDLPTRPVPATDTDEDVPLMACVVALALLLGLPVSVVLGLVYGAWWALAVPVSVSVALLYVEHLLTRAGGRAVG